MSRLEAAEDVSVVELAVGSERSPEIHSRKMVKIAGKRIYFYGIHFSTLAICHAS